MGRRILLLRLDAIGDFVLFTSALPHLRNVFEHDSITLTVHPDIASIAEHCPYVDEMLTIDQHRFSSDHKYMEGVIGKLSNRFDIAINTMYSRTWQSDSIIARTHAPAKIGFDCLDKDGQQDRRHREQILYTQLIHSNKEWMFELERYEQLLHEVGSSVNWKNLKPELWIQTDDSKWVDKLLVKKIRSTNNFAVLCPGAGFDIKHWSVDSWAEVADWIIDEYGIEIIIAGSEKDKSLASAIIAAMKHRAHDLTGLLTLNRFAALVTKANFFVGIDTAGFHIAWALGIPTIGIFGGGHFGRFTPSLPHVRIVHVPMDCYHCYWHCIYEEAKCITSILSAKVKKEVAKVLRVENKVVQY